MEGRCSNEAPCYGAPVCDGYSGNPREGLGRDALTIRKVTRGYRLLSRNGKNLGTFKTREAAVRHERQVNFFKHRSE